MSKAGHLPQFQAANLRHLGCQARAWRSSADGGGKAKEKVKGKGGERTRTRLTKKHTQDVDSSEAVQEGKPHKISELIASGATSTSQHIPTLTVSQLGPDEQIYI